MTLKKTELYSTIWQSCDALRGGMDASQYKDYVLVLLFIKYISDKYAGVPFAPIEIPEGASFSDMVALKGKPDIGDQINKKIIAPLASANKLSDMPDFNDATKLGTGKEMVDRWQKRGHGASSGAFKDLPERVSSRLTLENDDVNYTVRDLISVYHALSIPLVFDVHLHRGA